MRINLIIEITEEFRTTMREYGLRAGLLLALGALSAMLVVLTISFPMAALAVVCLLLAAWFGYGLRIVHKPSAFAREREALWIARLDAMLRQNEELREKIKGEALRREHDAAVFVMGMRTKDTEYQTIIAQLKRHNDQLQEDATETETKLKAAAHLLDEERRANARDEEGLRQKLKSAERAQALEDSQTHMPEDKTIPLKDKVAKRKAAAVPYAMAAAEAEINPTKIDKPKRKRAPTPAQARKARAASEPANG